MKTLFNFSILMLGITSSSFAQNHAQDEAAFRAIVQTMETGWNTKSGTLFASSFADVHDYVVINGLYFANQTPERNARAHQGIFDTHYRTTDLKLKIDKINFLRPDLALVHILGATYEHGTPVPENPGAVITMLVEKQTAGWKIISFHNCNIEVSFDPAEANRSPIPFSVMYHNWYN